MRTRLRFDNKTSVLCLLAVALGLTAALLAPAFSDPGSGMDEGIPVAYPTFIEHGEVPGRDFETFYGPGGPYLVAGAFEVLGAHVWVERAIGLLFRLLIVGSIFALLLYWGRIAALVGSIAAALVMLQIGVSALAWDEAIGLALLGLALAARAAATRRTAHQAGPVIAGAVSGLAVAFRPDIAPAAIVPAVVLLVGVGGLRRFALGFVLGVIPTLVWAGVVGAHGIDRLLSDLAASQPDRALPLPPLRSSLAPVLISMAAVTLALLATGAARLTRDRFDPTGWRTLALGLFSLALVPTTLERVAAAHVLSSGAVVLGFAPAASLGLAGSLRRRPIAAKLVAGAVGMLCAFTVLYASWPTVKHKNLGVGRQVAAYDVVNEGRSFPIGSEPVARGLTALLQKLDRIDSPGETVFVGPANLRLANYNDTFVYYLLPKLRPASFYAEINPGAANGRDSGLAGELRRADFLLLTSRYDHEFVDPGPGTPSRVVHSSFCRVARRDSYELLRRCDAKRPSPPRTRSIIPYSGASRSRSSSRSASLSSTLSPKLRSRISRRSS
jgi:hypothetical protein